MTERRRYRTVVFDSERWEGFRFRDGDVVISTPPKCGTTWMQTLCALLIFDTADLPRPVAEISPWLDMQLARREDVFAQLEAQTHRRFIKTHTPLDGLPYDDRVTYVSVGRDPRDAAVSGKHHMENMDLDRFLAIREAAVGNDDLPELMKPQDETLTPLQAWIEGDGGGSPMCLQGLVNHAATFWEARDAGHVALFHYEDMRTDLPGQMRRLRDVLECDVSDERVEELSTAATFDAMRSRADRHAPNTDIGLWRSNEGFFARGTSGQWREVFDDDAVARYERRMSELASPELTEWLHGGFLGATHPVPPPRGQSGDGSRNSGYVPGRVS